MSRISPASYSQIAQSQQKKLLVLTINQRGQLFLE
jgi:hypothetical protein